MKDAAGKKIKKNDLIIYLLDECPSDVSMVYRKVVKVTEDGKLVVIDPGVDYVEFINSAEWFMIVHDDQVPNDILNQLWSVNADKVWGKLFDSEDAS